MDRNNAVNVVVDFMAYSIHKLDRIEEFGELKKGFTKLLDGLGIAEDDLKRLDIIFLIIDTALTNRNFDESEQMFMHLVVLAGNKYGKPGIWATKEFMKEKIEEAKSSEYGEWRILEEFLCESPFAEASKNKYKGLTHILNSFLPGIVEKKTKILLGLDLKNIKVEIKNDLIIIENVKE